MTYGLQGVYLCVSALHEHVFVLYRCTRPCHRMSVMANT